MSPPLLSSLLALVASSTHTLQRELAVKHIPEPWIDKPTLHPWDNHSPPSAYWEARRILLGSLAMMTALVQDPREKILTHVMGYHHPAALNFVVRARIPDILASPDINEFVGLHVNEIAKRAGTNPAKTTTVLRFLCIHHIFAETMPLVFTNNKLSHVLKTEDPASAVPIFWGEIAFRSATQLSRTLRESTVGHSLKMTDSSFARTFRGGFRDVEIIDESVGLEAVSDDEDFPAPRVPPVPFTFLSSPSHKTYCTSFARGMQALDAMHGCEGLFAGTHISRLKGRHENMEDDMSYPYIDGPQASDAETINTSYLNWAQWDTESSVFVDIGSSTGHLAHNLLPLLDHTTFVCQDRLEVCEEGVNFFRIHHPDALAAGRIVFQGNDFLKGQPIKGATVYILQNILHDWPENEGLLILEHVATAMAPTSRLLVIEVVIRPPIMQESLDPMDIKDKEKASDAQIGADEEGAKTQSMAVSAFNQDRAPWPLLTNYGIANAYAHHQAMEMINLFNSLDRTLHDYEVLFERAGLELVRTHRVRKVVSVLEVKKRDWFGNNK